MVASPRPFHARTEFWFVEMMLGRVFSAGLVGMMAWRFRFYFSPIASAAGPPWWPALARAVYRRDPACGLLSRIARAALPRRSRHRRHAAARPWALNIEFVPVRMRSTIVTIIMMGYSFGTAVAAPMTQLDRTAVRLAGRLPAAVGHAAGAIALWLKFPSQIRFLVTKD